jgi:DNA-binding response OmpR family regulator
MNRLSVLMADDDPRIRQLVSVNLTRRKYAVHEVEDGEQAIEYLKRETPDLVILDLVMPRMSGADVCAWIRQRNSDVPIMVLSAYDEEDLKVRAVNPWTC